MRARGKDIAELFGRRPDDCSENSRSVTSAKWCPFVDQRCSKTNHDQTIVYGVCSVTSGARSTPQEDVIICPKRFYGQGFEELEKVARSVWSHDFAFFSGGDLASLRQRLESSTFQYAVVAFGQNSGKEVSIRTTVQLSMDWVLQIYEKQRGSWVPIEFVGLEIQSIDITGNYRNNQTHYVRSRHSGSMTTAPPDSEHGLNWANVHKRLIPQLIRKGNVYEKCARCVGFFFLVPDMVYQRFEQTLGSLDEQVSFSRNCVSVITYMLGAEGEAGTERLLVRCREMHISLEDVKTAFSGNQLGTAHIELNENLLSLP